MMCSLFGLIGQKSFSYFSPILTTTNPILNLYMSLKGHISFLDLNVSFCDGKLTTDLQVKHTDNRHQYLHTHRHILTIQNGLSYIVRH